MTKEDQETAGYLNELPEGYTWPYGCAMCIVELMDCVPSAIFHGPKSISLPFREVALGNYEIGRWVWRTHKLRALKEPVPIVGRQGLWIPSPEEQEKIYAQA